MTKENKVLGVVAIATLLVGLVIGSHLPKSATLGVASDATVITGDLSVTRDEEVGRNLQVDGDLSVAGSVPFATSSLSNLSVSGTVTSSHFAGTGSSTFSGTTTLSIPILLSPFWVKTSASYCTKVTASTTAAALTITTSTVCQ